MLKISSTPTASLDSSSRFLTYMSVKVSPTLPPSRNTLNLIYVSPEFLVCAYYLKRFAAWLDTLVEKLTQQWLAWVSVVVSVWHVTSQWIHWPKLECIVISYPTSECVCRLTDLLSVCVCWCLCTCPIVSLRRVITKLYLQHQSIMPISIWFGFD